MNHFSKEFQINYYEVDKYREATPISILNYLEETAISHSESAGLGMDRLLQDGVGWVLNRWSLVMDKYPSWNDRIRIETWPSSFERFYATREFLIKDGRDNILGKASSLWIFLNIKNRRPTRIPAQFGGAYGISSQKALINPFKDLESPDSSQYEKHFSVRRSDIDTNNHVNNTRYVEWLLESVPDDVYSSFSLSSLEVIYKKETNYGAAVHSGCIGIRREDFSHTYIHSITDNEGAESAIARTLWVKR